MGAILSSVKVRELAVLPIKLLPEPILRRKAKRVGIIDQSVHKLISDMIDTMRWAYGIGLAAPQIGTSLKIIVVGLPDEEPACLINPEVIRKGEEIPVEESCLSIPGYRGEVKRSVSVTVKGLDQNGKPIRLKAKDLLAQALQHEIDHVNGILYIDRMENPDDLQKVTQQKEDESGL